MSGFEVAGVVLGTLPLVIKAVEAYICFMKDWGKAASELKSINRQLTTERSKLYNVCDQLLSDVVPQKDIEPMLQDPFGPLWQAEDTKKRIRRRLWNSYEPFSKTVLDIQEALQVVQDKLSVDVTSDGQVKWVERRWMPREFRKFLYRLDRKDYQDALSTISKGVNDLESLTRLSVALEPSRRKRSGGRAINILRDLSSSVYRALRSSISCQCSGPHDVSLGLLPKKAPMNATVAVAEVTRHLRPTNLSDINLVNLPTTLFTKTRGLAVSIAPVDLCGTLKRAVSVRPESYGQLVDSECPGNCFGIFPTQHSTPGGNAWSIVTLHDVLWRKQGLQPLLWLEEKIRLALAVSSAVLQLSETPWLSKPLAREDVHFFRKESWAGYQLPFLRRQIPEPTTSPCGVTGQRSGETVSQPNETLFRLGILLLEIILGSTMENLREPRERIDFQGDKLGMIRDSITAHRLLQTQVALINPAYRAVVERCVGCGASQGLDEEGFRERVYNGVVAELEAILECTKLA
ncbi:hypothetical protein B0T14DRAFT_436388 [Immersiella caudata]|uniref:DUF7580 domain-containing protein n=1 Tax=Immersiella caudata TaxID=314043 RepID=A0AA39WFM2_9PEZI|nr:hypothetical protein B0T14DRAFT_436388 [Immersiella caudata]